MDIYLRHREGTDQRCQVCGVKIEVEVVLLDKKSKATILRLCAGCNYRLYNAAHEFQMKKLSERG